MSPQITLPPRTGALANSLYSNGFGEISRSTPLWPSIIRISPLARMCPPQSKLGDRPVFHFTLPSRVRQTSPSLVRLVLHWTYRWSRWRSGGWMWQPRRRSRNTSRGVNTSPFFWTWNMALPAP